MASHASEQSEITGTVSENDSEEIPNSAAQAMETDTEEVPCSTSQKDEFAQPEGRSSSGASVFCVVSYPDGHKELTADVTQTTERGKDAGIIDGTSLSDGSSFPGNSITKDIEDKEELMIEDNLQQEEIQSTDDNSKDLTNMETEENELLDLPGEGTSGLEQVNFADIDGAVERALLDEEEDSSNCKSNEESNADMGLTKEDKGDLYAEENKLSTELPPTGDQPRMMEKVLNIDEETRMSLDQPSTNDQTLSIDESFTYPSLPPRKLFQLDDTKDSELSETDTKLLTNVTDGEDSRMQTSITLDDTTNISATSDSNMETPASASSSRKAWRGNREGIAIGQDGVEGFQRVFTAEHLFEYQWPQDGGEWHLLQEQVSEYLNIKSFKRKYPDLERRVCDKEEKDFLREKGVVSETQSDLGLTALRSEEVYDLMMKDHNSKYQEYITFLQEKQKKIIREKHKEYSEQAKVDKSKMESYSKKAARSAAEFNSNMMKEKKDERRAYFDLQTYTIHWPKNKFGRLRPGLTKVGAYPVAILAGQFQDHYKKYTIDELKYLPVKTVVHDPKKPPKYIRAMPESVRLAILEKQKPPPEPEVEELPEAQVMDVTADNSENKENTEVTEVTANVASEQVELVPQAAESSEQPVTPAVKLEKKVSSKLSSKKRPKIELSPERPKKTPKKARESLLPGGSEDDPAAAASPRDSDASERSKAQDGKGLIPKIHGLEKCRICKQRSTKEERKNEKIVKCAQCGKVGHTSCLDLTEELVAVIKTYPWQCMECKTCVKCLDPFDEDKMMFCDRCDRGYHTFCIGLNALPTGHWECESCQGVPIVIRPKPPVEETNSLPAKTELHNESSTTAENGVIGTEPTLEAKKELIEGEEAKNSSISTDPNNQASIAPVVKVERRGRKRKYPLDPNRPVPDPNRMKALQAAKAERVTGERQSKRLKQKEEEEEEKRKKEVEEAERIRLKKEKKRRKKLKRLAAEAAAAAAAAAAARYGEGGAVADGGDGTGSGVTADGGDGTGSGVTGETKENPAEGKDNEMVEDNNLDSSTAVKDTVSGRIVSDTQEDIDGGVVDQNSKNTEEESKQVTPTDTDSKPASEELETVSKPVKQDDQVAKEDANLKLTPKMPTSDSSLLENKSSTTDDIADAMGTSDKITPLPLEQGNQNSVETSSTPDQPKTSPESANTDNSHISSVAKEVHQEIRDASSADELSKQEFLKGDENEVLSKPGDGTESSKDESDGQNTLKESSQAETSVPNSDIQDVKVDETVPESEKLPNCDTDQQTAFHEGDRSSETKAISQENQNSGLAETPHSDFVNPLSDTPQNPTALSPPSSSSAASATAPAASSDVISSNISFPHEGSHSSEKLEGHQSEDVLPSESSSSNRKTDAPSSSSLLLSQLALPLQTDTNSLQSSCQSDPPVQTETTDSTPASSTTVELPPTHNSQTESEHDMS